MSVDLPAHIAIFGAGPLGLEAALYARFLGYDVTLYERGAVAENVLAWGHVRMFSPFGLNRTKLALAALEAHDSQYCPPDDNALLTGRQWAEQYLIPLSKTDFIVDHLQEQTTVVTVGRKNALKGDLPGSAERNSSPFRILVRDKNQQERVESADIAIDTTGVFGNPNWLGQGGIPAIGETSLHDQIEYALPDILSADRRRFAGQHTLVIGSGYSAATNIVALADLVKRDPGTRLTWVVRRLCDSTGPIQQIANDHLPQRDQLALAANSCANNTDSKVRLHSGTSVVSLARRDEQFTVEFEGSYAGIQQFDRIIANVGFRGEHQIYQELQVHQCYASGGPMKLAAALLGQRASDCLDQKSHGPDTLRNPEPNFYILGSKSYGRNSSFLVSVGHQQIRELFSMICDRVDLDLYSGIGSLTE